MPGGCRSGERQAEGGSTKGGACGRRALIQVVVKASDDPVGRGGEGGPGGLLGVVQGQ